jgi:polar amino acid transport system substrate-binding protein
MLSIWCRACLTLGFLVTVNMSALLGDAQAQTNIEQIKSRGRVVIGTAADYPPFESVENGKIVGYDKEILDQIVTAWGVKLEQLDTPFSGILTGLLEKKFDFVATALIMNPERVQKYAFTMPVAVATVGMVKNKGDNKIRTVDNLAGLAIGAIIPPSGPTAVLEQYNNELAKNGKSAAKIVHFQTDADLFLALENRQIDAASDTTVIMNDLLKRRPGKFEIVGTFGRPFYIGWVTRPDDTQLRDAINAEIRKMRDIGELTRLQQKYFGFTMEIPDSGYLPEGAK